MPFEHMRDNYRWDIAPDWLVFIPGLVCGLNITCAAVGRAGDGVLTATPVYPPFFSAPRKMDRKVVAGRYYKRRFRDASSRGRGRR